MHTASYPARKQWELLVKKFEFNEQTQYFCIDPAHLAEGLAAAQGKHSAICVKPLDLRLKNLAFDLSLLASHTGITRLEIHPDIPIPAADFKLLEGMVHLEQLNFKECGPFDYSKLSKLRLLEKIGRLDDEAYRTQIENRLLEHLDIRFEAEEDF